MNALIGIRKEDKNRWERRAPLIPEHVQELKQNGIEIFIQPSKIRAFLDEDYIKAGATINAKLSECKIIFAIKEVPLKLFEPKKTYVFFSHTIKGQPHNMPMLKKLMDLKCQLIDYEKVVNEQGRRLIFFGRHAGLAGMIDTLWALGQRLNWEGISNPFCELQQCYRYKNLAEAIKAVGKVGERIKTQGITESLLPLIIGIAGYGNVSRGVQEILNNLPVHELEPQEIRDAFENPAQAKNIIYKVVFKEEHMVEPISKEERFELQDYYSNPEKYRSKFECYIPYLTVLVNAIYWDSRYPRFVTKEYLKKLYTSKLPRLRIIGDISCDINGAIECTAKATNSGEPVFVYDPIRDKLKDGWKGKGVVVLAVDNLPCELPKESSADFSEVLKKFVPELAKADFSVSFDQCKLPAAIKNAVIVYHGKLTPNYRYLEKFLSQNKGGAQK